MGIDKKKSGSVSRKDEVSCPPKECDSKTSFLPHLPVSSPSPRLASPRPSGLLPAPPGDFSRVVSDPPSARNGDISK